MKKKLNILLVMTLVLTLALAIPAFAAYDFEEVEEGIYEVTFTFDGAQDANAVYLAGEFNDWSPNHPDWEMELIDGLWTYTIEEIEEGNYMYKFVVNGNDWRTDWDAEDFADDGAGGQNSVLVLMDTRLDGEFKVGIDYTSQFEYLGEDEEFNFNNELLLGLSGSAFREVEEGEREEVLVFSSDLKIAQDIGDIGSAAKATEASLDEFSLESLNLTYLHDLGNISLQANTFDRTNSYGPLALMHSGQVSTNDSRRVRVESDKWLDFNAALTEYTDDITDEDSRREYLGYINAQKTLMDDSLDLGASINYNQLVTEEDGIEEYQDVALIGTVFGEYRVNDGLTVRGQYSNVPGFQGELLNFILDADCEDAGLEIDNDLIKAVYAVGNFEVNGDEWYDGAFPGNRIKLEYNDVTERWEGSADQADETIAIGTTYKFHIVPYNKEDIEDEDWFDWNDDHEFSWFGDPNNDDEDFEIVVGDPYVDMLFDIDSFDRTHVYMTELEYVIVDERASLMAQIATGDTEMTVNKGEFTLGMRAFGEDAFLLLADETIEDHDNRTEFYARGNYSLLENLKVDADLVYADEYSDLGGEGVEHRVGLGADWTVNRDLNVRGEFLYLDEIDEDEIDEKTDEDGNVLEVLDNGFREENRKFRVEMDWHRPLAGLDFVNAHIEFDNEDDFDEDKNKQEIFVETQTGLVPFTEFVKVNTTQRFDSGVNGYYAETSLDLAVDVIDYVNADVFFAQDDVSTVEIDDEDVEAFEDGTAVKYSLEARFHNLPSVGDYVNHITLGFESDVDGIIDHEDYDDDDNDWKRKFSASTMLELPTVEEFHGLTIELEMQNIEDGEIDEVPDDLDEDDQYYVADGQKFVEWYSTLTFLTGYDFSETFRTNITVKYDLSHGEISEYEDDAIHIALTKELNDNSELSASYNRRDEDNGEDYVEVLYSLTF
ncbi:isoamylase early set domain-containing protein [Halonatronum saccharophilum]|uniref:isoamylase early set domain-containing protein n=1 Tax=Halonatronum saccharophilum TaxID=150060 RepID=UPI0004805E14|nr:isoamylase early set domain-containing protein [Halonatronum saccharophilum]